MWVWRHVKGGINNWQDPGFSWLLLGCCMSMGVCEGERYRFSWGCHVALWMWRCIKEGSITDQAQVFLWSSGSCVNVKVYKGGIYNWPGPGFLVVVRLLCESGGGGKHSLTLAATQGISSHQVRFLRQLAQRQQHHIGICLSLLGNVGWFWLWGSRPHLLLLIVFIVIIG